ncbi:anhydro-N-acetylmuramic acid kinase [Methylococcus sp. EFPC2]|uniref:anhydro-N-acetylmuramic acid kinase n=1 Tax=Methylococcus sp. EFPC2 TaxID=2812648 RepID=UPI0019674C92|nr:anhydro-N-acetylmuramic acid kinase [Methylococcus sp. EFPC2]QSA98207.1 anhydro-N-acetylmuramic acid kinase [Methylococcus sp. EFPC2]
MSLPHYFIGLMSGTSLDGIDAVLVSFTDERPEVHATYYRAYEPELRQALARLCYAEKVEMRALGEADARLGLLFGACVTQLLEEAGIGRDQVAAIGSHGQTVFHHPQGPHAFSLQIGDPSRIAQTTGITTIADFRRRDIAAGGQGAPLAPAFHRAVFQSREEERVIVNLGGIANLTVLPKTGDGPVFGFDSGPGNTLMDGWVAEHLGHPRDDDGTWARSGRVDVALLQALLSDPYFDRPPPKSTGQEYFSRRWLHEHLAERSLRSEDVQATLCELTASSVTQAISRYAPDAGRILLCGGGVHNGYLRERIAGLAHGPVASTASLGLHPDWVEAVAFAWLARQTLNGLPGNLPEVTGAGQPVVLGGIYRP